MSARPKILFVAMHDSVHAARWIEQAARLDYECHVFPLSRNLPHHKLANVTLHVPTLNENPPPQIWSRELRRDYLVRVAAFGQLLLRNPREALRRVKNLMLYRRSAAIDDMPTSAPINSDLKTNLFGVDHVLTDLAGIDERIRLGRASESDETALRLHGPEVLAALIEELKPDLIHSMEFQHAGYLVLGVRDRIAGRLPVWLATNWGSDIYHFGKSPDHALQIRRLCEAIDLYSCECHRDLAIGRQFGYRGPDLPVLPNSGGIDIEQILTPAWS